MTKKNQKHLTATERHILMHLLNKFKDMFDGTLVMWNKNPVDLEFKDNAKPVCSRTYPLPKAHKIMFKKEVERIITLGVLEESNDPE